jgi:hypothetical protein
MADRDDRRQRRERVGQAARQRKSKRLPYDLRWDELYSRLLDVLRELPVIESRRDDVEGVAQYLCSAFFSPPHDFYPITKQDERDLQMLWKRVNALRLQLARMSGIAVVAVGIDRGCLPQLAKMERTAERALERLRAQPGRPRKRRAEMITAVAALGFWWLTGKHPSRRTDSEGAYGPFLDFLERVFDACKFAESTEAQFKAFQRKFRFSMG